MSKEEIKKVIETFFIVLDNNEFKKMGDLYTEDAIVIEPGYPVSKGRENIIRFFREANKDFRKVEHIIHKIIVDGNNAACVKHSRPTLHDESRVDIPDVNIFEMRNNKIHRQEVYFDTALLK